MSNFKVGDRVIKYRAYSESEYCFHGGSVGDVPLGTKGTITDVNGETNIGVKFDNEVHWTVHAIEIKPADIDWRRRLSK